MQIHKCMYAACVCVFRWREGNLQLFQTEQSSVGFVTHSIFSICQKIATYEPQSAPTERKTCVRSKKKGGKYSHTCTDHFSSHRLKCETRHTRSAAKWHSNDTGMVSLLGGGGTTATKKQRHAVTAQQDAKSIQSEGQRLAEARDTQANSAA